MSITAEQQNKFDEALAAYEARTRATVTVHHNGQDYHAEIGRIKSTSLGNSGGAAFTANVHIEWSGGGVGVGNFALDYYDKAQDNRVPTAYGMDQIIQLMKVVGVDRWEDMPGKTVMALFPAGNGSLGSMSVGLASEEGNRAIVLEEHYDQWVSKNGPVDTP